MLDLLLETSLIGFKIGVAFSSAPLFSFKF
jgi:hypothetical protein